ncbi:T9SS sorting signal type C domain-containing protein [Flavobacterium paronense]|uniref:T9SS sorting signal type C domain-containing protein n=1 Tax=Flavobacterium paronense TaxID=1392775 RepID=A0ABV5GEA5_9FLAO|nr:T9SS sorting signal type C domain-containing protein [Flavobacterium paronense]MDN3678262.1 T9SS sorting signal type C domain-containing protein [Flavobacterium paronense]
MKFRLLLVAFFVLVLNSVSSYGQVNIPSATPVTQNFDALGSSATATLPTGFVVNNNSTNYTTGTTATVLAYGTSGTGAVTGTSGAGIINWANGVTASATDRSLGFLTGSSLTSPRNIIIQIKNTGATNITDLAVAFDYEKYRTGTRAFNWTFTHGATGTAVNTSNASGDQAYAADAANGVVNPPTTISKTLNLTGLTIAPNGFYYLCWTLTGVGGATNGQGMGIDNLSLTATFAVSCAAPTLSATTSASAIATTSVTLNGDITAVGGGTNITTRGFQYATNAALTTPTTVNTTGTFGVATFNQSTGSVLTANTLYYYRAYAINDCASPQTGYSHTSSFPTFTTIHNAPTIGVGNGETASSFVANWTAPTGGSATYTYTIEVDDNSDFSSVVSTITGISSASISQTISGLASATTYYFRIKVVNAGGSSAWSATSAGVLTLSPAPEINVKQGVTSIAHNGSQTFATTAIGAFTDLVFTIENTGSANLTFTTPLSISGTDYTLIAPLASSPVAAAGTTTFTVRFTPTTTGTRIGSVTINGTNDTSEPTYIINFTATATPSNLSDIIANAGYVYNSNIAYATYQSATISNTTSGANGSIDLFKFDIRDGGGAADLDGLPTILSGITFNVTNIANIRTAALFNGNAMVNNVPTINTGAGTIAFAGLSGADVTASTGGSTGLTLRVTFLNAVTDNQQIQVTIANANVAAAGSNTSSTFAAFTSVVSSTTSDRNRIEVTADRLAFVTQPVNTAQNAAMATAPTVKASDIFGNIDLDYTTSIVITSTGAMTGEPITVSPTSGVSTFSGIVHTSSGTYTLEATSGSLTLATSNSFVISAFTFAAGDMRPKYATNLSFNGDWEYYDGSTWLTGGAYDNKAPQNTANTVNRVLIDKYVGGGGTTSKNYNCDFIIQSGGYLYIDANIASPTFTFIAAGKKAEVLSGGTLDISGDIKLNSTGNLIVRAGGDMILNQNSVNNVHPMWDGVELFEGGSTVTINDWGFTGAGSGSLINTSTAISSNANGYKFGNLVVDINPGFSWSIIGGGIGIINLCENDFDISNASSNYIHGATNRTGTNGFVVNGNMTIYDGPFSFGSSFTTDAFNHQFTVNGNFECGSNDDLKIHYIGAGTPTTLSGNVTFKGDVKIASTVTSFTNDGGSGTPARMTVNFDGGTLVSPKLIDIAPVAVAIPMTIKGTSVRKFATQDLTTNSVGSYTAPFTVETGGTLHFGWATNGTTPLVIKKTTVSAAGTNTFASQTGTTLIVTSLDGLQQLSATTGNVQYSSSNKTYNQTGVFWFVGVDNQVTGDVFTTGGTAKTIICELIDNTKKLTLSSATSITSPGLLNIKKGQFIESTTALLTGSDGGLTMEDGTLYQIPGLSSSSTDLIPRVVGLSNVYNLADNSTIELNGADGASAFDQYLRGTRSYKNLKFSTSGVKTISSAISSITGTITVANTAILDVEDKGMGGAGTNLTMTGTSEYRTAGAGVKPDASGTYALGTGTKVTFTSGSILVPILTLQQIRLAPNYYNIDVVGNNVGTNTLTSPVKIQAGGTFKVKATGIFKHSNTAGFNGSAVTAIDNTNSPTITLETGSTVEYAGANQTVTLFNSSYYTNLTISGTGTKSLQNATQTFVNEDLNVSGSILLVNTDEVITVRKGVKIATVVTTDVPDFQIKNNGQLIQIDDADANSGTDFQLIRNYTATNVDYVYWGAPTKSFAVSNLPNGFRYEWNPLFSNSNGTQGNWNAPSTTNMTAGRGYIARTFNGSATAITLPFTFRGRPNNGAFTTPISRGSYYGDGITTGLNYTVPSNPNPITVTRWDDNWNLVSNPYPSAINALTFLSASNNPDIEGFVYLWTHQQGPVSTVDPYYSDFILNYSSTVNYVLYNSLGVSSGPISFNGKIASGQGFFVLMSDGSTTTSAVNFNNSMRYTASTYAPYNNSQFFKTTSPAQETINEEEKHRIWLDIISAQGDSNRILIGYAENATNDKDRMYDAITGLGNSLKIVSYLNTENPQGFIIQGRGLPFNENDTVRLGVAIPSSGTYMIGIGALDGMFHGSQNIYIEDKLLNVIQSIKTHPYTFTSNAGQFENRFVLRYTDGSALDNPDFGTVDSSVVVATNHGEMTIKSHVENIQEVTVYDVLGRQLFFAKAINKTNFVTSTITMSQQTLIVKIKLENGVTISRKIIL